MAAEGQPRGSQALGPERHPRALARGDQEHPLRLVAAGGHKVVPSHKLSAWWG